MSDQYLRIDTFNNLFFDFINDLMTLFPNDPTLLLCKTGAQGSLLINNKFIVTEFKTAVLPYSEHILKKNEDYFLHENFKENFGNDHFISNEINRIVNIWKDPNTSNDTKKMIWIYMIKLVKLSKTIN